MRAMTNRMGNNDRFRSSQVRSSSSTLLLCLMFMSGIYAGWFIFVLKNFHSLASNQNNDGKNKHMIEFNTVYDPVIKKDVLPKISIESNEHQLLRSATDMDGKVLGNVPSESNMGIKNPITPAKIDLNYRNKPSINKPQPIGKISKGIVSNFKFNRDLAEKAISEAYTRTQRRIKTLTAFLEQPMNDIIPGTGDQGTTEKYIGIPADYVIPLPLRTTTPEDLRKIQYPKVNSCHNLQAKLPVDEGLILDKDGKPIVSNIGNNHDIDVDLSDKQAKICPVDADPWLPWIHDVFPSPNGDTIRFVAQNRRRCKTSVRYVKMLRHLEPQIALMQHVSVKRLDGEEHAKALAPELWSPSDGSEAVDNMPRYRLAPFEESDEDGKFTRFICRFHSVTYDFKTSQSRDIILGETLSTYPVNYEFASFRKGSSSMITPRGKDNGSFWLSSLQFDCPVPENGNLKESISSGDTVLDDGTPTVYVDIVPIRTSTRFGSEEAYFPDYMTGFDKTGSKGSFYPGWLGRLNTTNDNFGFDPKSRWGDKHVLPRFEASGRLENVPVCTPPKPVETMELPVHEKATNKHHGLVACLWASASFHTRGNAKKVIDTSARIQEWIEFNLMTGFDHIYVYDNSGAHTNETSLAEALSVFDDSEVTRIDWPYLICNNNIPAHANTGERSSQYAAEVSCNRRFGPYTEWMGVFDADEYLIPMGEHKDMKDVLKKVYEEKGTNVLSFKSTRAYPNFHLTQADGNHNRCGTPEIPKCRVKRTNETFLDSYNCDLHPLPKPGWADRAKKQLFRPEYVPSHFVHYATITKGLLETYEEAKEKGKGYNIFYNKEKTEHFTDEINDAVMIHAKTMESTDSVGYTKSCKLSSANSKQKCWLGFPFPNNVKDRENLADAEGYMYNCYQNQKVINYWGPLLRSAMKKRGTLIE